MRSLTADPPRCVRRALHAGLTTRQILARYPVDAIDVRRWRWRLRLPASPGACSLPLADLQAQLDGGATVAQAAAALGQPVPPVVWLANAGVLLVRPQSPGYPCPVAWARACGKAARRLRHELAHDMLAAGLSTRETAEVLGVSQRAVRMWRATRAAARR